MEAPGRTGHRPVVRGIDRASWLLLLAALLSSPLIPGSPFAVRLWAQTVPAKKVSASLLRLFGPGTQVDTLAIEGSAVLRVSRGDSLLGFAQVRDVRGKEQPITWLVALDPALTLRDIDVLVYREAYGGEIAYEPWRKQFRGRSPRDALEVGRTVRGISGATISVNAVTLGIRQALVDFARWRQAGLL